MITRPLNLFSHYDDRLERLSRLNNGALYGEETMLEMLHNGSLLTEWQVPDEEIFGTESSVSI